MSKRKTKYERAVDEAADFNKAHKTGRSGIPVLFWLGVRTATPQESVTRGEAWALPCGDAVIRVQGRPGGIALSHIEVIPQPVKSEVLQ